MKQRSNSWHRPRLPLRTLTVATADPERLAPFVSLIADEVNVREDLKAEQIGDIKIHYVKTMDELVPIALSLK